MVKWNGWRVKPGHVVVNNGADIVDNRGHRLDDKEGYQFVERTPTHLLLTGRYGDPKNNVFKVPIAMEQAGHINVFAEPQKVSEIVRNIVDANTHGSPLWNPRPEQSALIHGMDLDDDSKHLGMGSRGINAGDSHWRILANGTKVYVKGGEEMDARNEIAYHNAAHSVFGMGEYVTNGALFKHPETGQMQFVTEAVPQGFHETADGFDSISDKVASEQIRLRESGELQKLAMMNYVMGNDDRHGNNYMWAPHSDGTVRLKLIDHGIALRTTYDAGYKYRWPSYSHRRHDSEKPLDEGVSKWLNQIDPKTLEDTLSSAGINTDSVQQALQRLQRAKAVEVGKPWMSKHFYNY
jgi:hypothetical protein